jgi:hypothetical protein
MNKNAVIVGALVVVSLAFIAFGVFQMTSSGGGAQPVSLGPTPTLAEVQRISVQDLSTAVHGANPPLIWDVRDAQSYAQQHIPGARFVQLADIPTLAQTLNRNQNIVTVCS